ncbi:MAG: Gfo/Idh/MocA family oxidoreductase [Chloroflexi bacterium]|nr:Gfo/Idh/MocA family oxidoreductase [Chloroflexota bacterium]
MTQQTPVRVAVIGCGGAARAYHIRRPLHEFPQVQFRVVCEPSAEAYAATCALFEECGVAPPPNEPDLNRLLAEYAAQLDVAVIATPHAYHHDQTVACMEAGLDVLLEKPMAMNATEAQHMIDVRDRTGRLLVVAFDGGLSPYIHTAAAMLRDGAIGELRRITAVVWQDWRAVTVGAWRQQIELSGGGFMFDTGAHMLNTVAELAGEPIVEVTAWVDHLNSPVDVQALIVARLASGVLITLNGCGDTGVGGCESEIRLFGTRGMLRTGIWGEFLEHMAHQEEQFNPVTVPRRQSTWLHFLAVRSGELENPCPPEVGLRMNRLWDAIQESSAQGGRSVRVG